jgi:hypothetical protein
MVVALGRGAVPTGAEAQAAAGWLILTSLAVAAAVVVAAANALLSTRKAIV